VDAGSATIDGKVTLAQSPLIGNGATLRLSNSASGVDGNSIGGTGVSVGQGARLEVAPNALGTGASNTVNLEGGTLALFGTASRTAGAITINGFGDGSDFQVNGGATIQDGVLNLTTPENSQARSAFATSLQSVTSDFQSKFTYHDVNGGGG
jgi:hypothetical protein